VRHQGKITDWNDDRGFGFITPNGGGERVFLHIKAFSDRQQRPARNELVTYALTRDAKGRLQAGSVAFVGKRTAATAPLRQGNLPLMLAAAFLALVAVAVLSGRLPVEVAGLYLAASVVAFLAYALDKSAAKNDQWRMKESTLHLIGLAGGWPGALAAQRLFRHKSSKPSFQLVSRATVVLNCGALAWLLTAPGTEMLQALLGPA
jgi:uncharacterized membrane protein YsdA (DUF1294 family)/cold shock CspA family protein